MIMLMKKVSVVLMDDTKKSSLKALRKAGVLHLEQVIELNNAPEILLDQKRRLEEALAALPSTKAAPFEGRVDRERALVEADAILGSVTRKKEILESLDDLSRDRDALLPWGDFDPADLKILSAKGIILRLVIADKELRNVLAEDPSCEFVSLKESKNATRGVVVYRESVSENGVEGLDIPQYGLGEIQSISEELRRELDEIDIGLKEKAVGSAPLRAALLSIVQDMEFETVKSSIQGEERLAWFSGFIPVDDVETLKSLASEQSWGLVIADPGPEDIVPTMVKNNAAIRIIQPVFDLMGIYPGYREHDISFWFLLFLSIFVAMILGDAAYGLAIILLVGIVRIKSGKPSDTLRLLTVFGFTTFLWGTVTGTWFSSLAIVENTFLKNLVIPAVATYQTELFPDYSMTMSLFPGDRLDANDMVKWLSLLFGILMVSIARIQSFIRKLPDLSAFAQLGWLSIVLALYWLIMELVLQLNLLPFITQAILPMILGGIATVLLFSGQTKGKPFLKGVLDGLKDILPTALDSIGAFGDIISFIRLFAVGLAGVALSQSFNSMAPKGGVIAMIAAVLILTFGHTLNLVLNALSVLVHGVRLNVLEFSGHLDMEWAGFGFEPFRLRVPESDSPEAE